VAAGAIVVATNAPVNDRVVVHTKQTAYLSYVVAGRIPKGSVEQALFWDTENPFHYVRTQSRHGRSSDAEWLLVGGEDHRTGQEPDTDRHYRHLERWARERFPMID